MDEPRIPLDAYLERIRYSGPVAPSEPVLETLQRAQLASVPFENFDILLGRGISVEPTAIIDKLLHRRRGGYCFELNGLLYMALQAVGFEVRPLLARVHLSGQASGRGHELLLVSLHDRLWIADAGFGGPALRAPIPLELDVVRMQDGHAFRLTDAGVFGTMLQSRVDGVWRDLYSFDASHVCDADIVLGNHFTSTHPSSFFTFARVAALHTAEGSITLFNQTLRRLRGTQESTEVIPEGPAFLEMLAQHFGIELDAPYDALRPLAEPATTNG